MLKRLPILFSLVFLLQAKTFALVFETDKRIDIYQTSKLEIKEIARSVFTFIPKEKLIKNKDGSFGFKQLDTLKSVVNLCEGELFSEQPSVGTRCSGFLATEALGITAGHCVAPALVQDFCQNYYIIFDYKFDGPGISTKKLEAGSVRECDKIQKLVFDPETLTGEDYAIIHFSNDVKDRRPLKFRISGKVKDKSELFMLGHPKGMAVKVSQSGQVISNSDAVTFGTNLDCFRGNSGSPVFNAKDLIVEGIFIRGSGDIPNNSKDPSLAGDFFANPQLKCNQTLVCKKSEGCTAAMHAMRTTRISFK
jgi:V8-like Glu-specific endopeptidase